MLPAGLGIVCAGPRALAAQKSARCLEARGKGILLLHDIHPATVSALPGLLRELKEQGFRVVQVVPLAVKAGGG
jgi:peptidoglycan/xylan/chitin deacetylase (PgdA/CDA1 family)